MSHLRLAFARPSLPTPPDAAAPAPACDGLDAFAERMMPVARPSGGLTGAAVLPASAAHGTRIYVCDQVDHCIRVFDGHGEPAGAFGGHGTTPGRFAGPADITLVRPRFSGEADDAVALEPYLAIADRFNSRVQVLTVDGVFVGSLGSNLTGRRPAGRDAGWPFFRVTDHPRLQEPVHLTWHGPWLDVACADGEVVRVDLAQALLPRFSEWRHAAGPRELERAVRYFHFARLGRRALPGDVLAALTRARDVAA